MPLHSLPHMHYKPWAHWQLSELPNRRCLSQQRVCGTTWNVQMPGFSISVLQTYLPTEEPVASLRLPAGPQPRALLTSWPCYLTWPHPQLSLSPKLPPTLFFFSFSFLEVSTCFLSCRLSSLPLPTPPPPHSHHTKDNKTNIYLTK